MRGGEWNGWFIVQFSNEILTYCPSIPRCRPAISENLRNLENKFLFSLKKVPRVASNSVTNPHVVCVTYGGFILDLNSLIRHFEELARIWYLPSTQAETPVNNLVFLENEAIKWKTALSVRGEVSKGVPYQIWAPNSQ